MLLDLTVSAFELILRVAMWTLDFADSIGTLGLPSLHKTVSTKSLAFRQWLHETNTIRSTLDGFFLTEHPLIDDRSSIMRSRNILFKFLILSKWSWNERPWFRLQLIGILFFHQTRNVVNFQFVEFSEKIFLCKRRHNPQIEFGYVFKCFEGICFEDLIPTYNWSQMIVKSQRVCVEISLATLANLIDRGHFHLPQRCNHWRV